MKYAGVLCTKSQESGLLCATSVFSVSLWLMNSEQKHTTETQSTQRLHREISKNDFLCKATPEAFANLSPRFEHRENHGNAYKKAYSTLIQPDGICGRFHGPPQWFGHAMPTSTVRGPVYGSLP